MPEKACKSERMDNQLNGHYVAIQNGTPDVMHNDEGMQNTRFCIIENGIPDVFQQCSREPPSRKDINTHRQILLARFMQAMREDLAEWINSLSYQNGTCLTANNFMDMLDNGIILCQQARMIQRFAEEYAVINPGTSVSIPSKMVYYTEKGAYSGSFVSRDNVANFISWCRDIGIAEVVLFESEDLVLHKNEKNVILTILDVARKAFQFGVQPPELVKLEEEIDREIAKDEEDAKQGKPAPKVLPLEEDNDLDTLVRKVINQCTCGCRFPIKKLSDGKYKIGKTNTLIFVRVMRKHVMVRIGGGWDTLEHYIEKHDPCRTQIAGNIEPNGLKTKKITKSEANSISPIRKQSRVDVSLSPMTSSMTSSMASSDTWSMCSSEGTGSTGSNEGKLVNDRRESLSNGDEISYSNRIASKNADLQVSASDNDALSSLSSSSASFKHSIRELDEKLRQLEDAQRSESNLHMKDTAVYDSSNDSWLRSHMNQLKARKKSGDFSKNGEEFVLQRGYSDLVKGCTNSHSRIKGKENGETLHPRTQSENKSFQIEEYNQSPTRKRNALEAASASNGSISNDSRYKSASTQTMDEYNSNIPRLKSNGKDTPSRIPRPSIQRSRSMVETDTSTVAEARVRRKKTATDEPPRMRRGHTNDAIFRRTQKTNELSQHSNPNAKSRDNPNGLKRDTSNGQPHDTSTASLSRRSSDAITRNNVTVAMRREKSSDVITRNSIGGIRREKSSDSLSRNGVSGIRREKSNDSISRNVIGGLRREKSNDVIARNMIGIRREKSSDSMQRCLLNHSTAKEAGKKLIREARQMGVSAPNTPMSRRKSTTATKEKPTKRRNGIESNV